MLKSVFGKKIEMSQVFLDGARVPVTKIGVEHLVVTAIKTTEKDGYWAIQLGVGKKNQRNLNKPMKVNLKGATTKNMAPRFLREVEVDDKDEYKKGDKIEAIELLNEGDLVNVIGVSKGKGFAGVVKRWKFKGSWRTHGQKSRRRAPGSIGQGTTPGRVRKGKKMGGRMGSDTINVKKLKVVRVDKENGQIFISGSIPGSRGTLVKIVKI